MKSFEQIFLEEKLDAEDREKIKEDDWGVIIKDKDGNITEKAYPMPDAQHVISAARMYPFAKRKYDAKVVAELRRKIIAKAKEYNVPDSRIQSVIDDKPGGKSKHVKESVGPEDDTSGTSEFDESVDNDPDDCYTEAYDAITGEEIPIDHAYTMDEMREITLSITEDAKPGKLMKVSPPDSKYVYFGSPENYMPEIKLDRPLFVTPYKSIASIFIWNDMDLQNRIPKGSYNCQYEEWLKFNKNESGRCLKDVHVYVEGYPDLEPYEIEQTGYVHQILTHNWNDNYYRYPWMDASKEWLIVNDNGNVEFDDVIKCTIKYHITGKPGWKGLGPAPGATYEFVKHTIKLIHDKYKKDQKDPVGNQNCLLCTWCFEARMRGLDVLPRPVYSPRDDVLDIPGNQIVFGSRQIKLKNYTDLASEITGAGDGCRFYVHVNWKDSKGGHEFIIMRIGGRNFIIDPQQGKIEPLTKSHNYVVDINYANSYIVQLSDKKFNRNLFDKWNDESTVLQWDPKKDIPYMLKEGMITKEEAEKELKNHPVQESTLPKGIALRPAEEKDLPNIIQWKLESINQDIVDDPKVIRFIKNDARENLNNTRMIMCDDATIGVLESCYIDDGEWWYIGEIYLISEYRGKGIAKALLQDEIDSHDKLKLKVSKDNDHAIELYKSLGFIISESDEYSYVMTLVKDSVQEGFFNRKKTEPPKPCELYKQFEDAYNDETFISIIKSFKNHKSSLLSGWLHKTLGDDDYMTDDMVDGNVVSFLSKQQLNDMDMTDNNYNVIGYGFATVNNPDEWLSISMIDGKVYYCGDSKALEYSENVVADSFNEFLASFGDVFESYLKGKPIQESWNTEESLKLFKKLPKDLQEFLKKGDFSDINEDYGVDGYIVEEFSSPEYLEIAGKSYDLKDDDPMYNAIDFATDGGGNDFVYNPNDGYYYNLDHEDYDIYDHIHGDRLSSTKWSELIDPTRKSNKSSNPNVERSHEFGIMTESHLYWDICHVVLDDEIDTKLCNKINDDYDVARKGTWHDEFFKKVDEFASKYDCSYIKAPVDEFKSFMKRDFRPTMFNWNFNIDGLKPKCMNIIKAFMKVIKDLNIDTTKLFPPAYKLHKQIIAKYGTKMFQEGVIQNIKNKTSPFEKNLVYHISPEGHLDGQIFKPRVPEYLDKYDPSKTEFEDVETPRVCFSPSIEGCLNAIIVNIGRWKTADKLRDWYVYIPEKPLKEYKYRTNKQLVDEKRVYDANITKEIWIEEPVRLKQYGIIRIDSVSDKSRKKAVPTTTGESKKRNVYDFKWHWLVKPKVLKDVPYDYSPLEVCKDMVADLERYKYGIPENGKIVNGSEHDYDTKWKLQSPEEFEKNGGGICFDFVEFEEGYLDAYGIKCKKYFISTDLPGNDTHTFILVDDGHGGFVYPESSAEAIAGVHQVKNLNHACNIVADGFWKINDNLNKVKPEKDPNITKPLKKFKCYLWEYTGHPPYGSNMKQCTEYYSKGEPIKEWYQVEPNLGEPIKESHSPIHEFVNNFRNQGGHING